MIRFFFRFSQIKIFSQLFNLGAKQIIGGINFNKEKVGKNQKLIKKKKRNQFKTYLKNNLLQIYVLLKKSSRV